MSNHSISTTPLSPLVAPLGKPNGVCVCVIYQYFQINGVFKIQWNQGRYLIKDLKKKTAILKSIKANIDINWNNDVNPIYGLKKKLERRQYSIS